MKSQLHYCAKCGCHKQLQQHHVFPRRNYGEGVRITLCQDHHRELEAIIFQFEGKDRKCLSPQVYSDITIAFLQPPPSY